MSSPATPSPADDRIGVLYVIWSLQMGGAERVVYDLARGIDRRVFRPNVCCLNFKGRLGEELEREGVPVFALDKRPGVDTGVISRISRLMHELDVSVVNTHLWTSSFWGRLAARRARMKTVVVTEHNLDLWRRPWHRLADRWLARRTNHFVFVSEEVRDFYQAYLRLPADRFDVILNGIDLTPFRRPLDREAARSAMGLPAHRPILGVVGRLEERKGHRFFLSAMKELCAQHPEALGLVVGEGREMEALRRLHAELALGDSVKLQGYWPDLTQALAAIDIFVLPSLMEGHPLAALEAMAAGKPVVATRVGGNARAVEEGVCGLLVPPGDPVALKAAMSALLSDPARAEAMGREGRRRVEARFDLRRAVEANEQLYRRYAGARKGAVR
jgi:glycosyltransferase involved in cell wall biosynthesis